MCPEEVIPLIKLNVRINKEKTVKGVYDAGSNVTLVNYTLIKKLKSKLMEYKGIFKTLSGINFTRSRAKLHMRINKIEEVINVYVVRNNNFSYDLLLGLDAIKKFRLIQDENLDIFQRVQKDKIEQINVAENRIVKEDKNIKVNFNEYINVDQFEANLDHLTDGKKYKILHLMKKHEIVFARNKFDVGTVQNHEAQIKLLEYKYVSKKPYRCSIPDQKEIESQVTKLLDTQLIEESSSPFAAPVTLAYKKEDGRRSRLCIDFRELNKLVVPEPQPFPRIEDIIIKAGNCEWFSTFDINSAFWSIPIRKKDRKKTAFVTQSGHYQWICLPFGLKIAPAVFQRILTNIIRRNGLSDFCINYIDDILIFSKSFKEHLKHIEMLMEVIKKEGFKLKLIKCNFAKSSIKYLGHIVEKNGVRPAKDNLKAIYEFERPKNKKNVRQLLGKINFYYKYIEDACKKLEPLHNLLRKTVVFNWTDECENAFQDIKNYLCSSPILAIYDQNRPVYIYTDASGIGLGAILKQPQDDGLLHPVAYFSRRLKQTELKKKVIYLECLAIKEAIIYWQHWLIGREFTVISDHRPLESMRVKARTDEALGDLMYYLSQYQFKIIYSSGKNNIEADSLSRNPVLESFENEEDVLKVVNFVTMDEIINDQKSHQEMIRKSKNTTKKGNICFKNLKNRQRIFVSQEFGKWLIGKIHEFYGHIGTHHLCQKLRPFYYFKNMDKMIEQFCKKCEICIKNKTRNSRPIGKLSKLGPAVRPFEIMSIDTVGGFSGNRSSKRYMHILVDHFSRRAFISTTTGQAAKDFIHLIDQAVGNEEVKIILADQYSAINSIELKEYLERKNILLVFTAVDHPESNGLNERLNQTLVNRIRCKINGDDKRAWPKIAKDCVEEYNRTDHSVTKFAPDYLMYGKTSEIIPIEFIEDRDIQKDRVEALLNSIRNFEKNKWRIDKNRREEEFKENDFVYVENGNRLNKNKLNEIRIGPFRVLRRISTSIYEVDCGKKKKEANLFHSSKLTRACGSPPGGEI